MFCLEEIESQTTMSNHSGIHPVISEAAGDVSGERGLFHTSALKQEISFSEWEQKGVGA